MTDTTAMPIVAHQYVEPRPDPTHLAADSRDNLDVLRKRLFSVLADIAFPVVEHYRGDLMNDVHWIEDWVNDTEPMTFFYGADGWGTGIGTDRRLVGIARDRVWRVDIQTEPREFSTRISIVTTELEAS